MIRFGRNLTRASFFNAHITTTLKGRNFQPSTLFSTFIDSSKILVNKTTRPKEKTKLEDLAFGKTFSDHMLSIDWDLEHGWANPEIYPYQDLKISPAATSLHYGIQCFEGMKAYKDSKNRIRLFRPDLNMIRFNFSMQRLAMPALDKSGFLECLKKLLVLDQSWIPEGDGYSLYIRPTAIGTSRFLGVHASEQVKIFVICSPVGPYFKSGFVPVKLFADTENARAWPGGVGNAKVWFYHIPVIMVALSFFRFFLQLLLFFFNLILFLFIH